MEAPEAPSPSPACEPDPVSPPVRPDDVPVLIRHGVLHEVVKRRLVDDLILTVILDEQDHQAMLRARAAGVLDLRLPAGSAGGSSCGALPATHR
jgi:hypothetical protein